MALKVFLHSNEFDHAFIILLDILCFPFYDLPNKNLWLFHVLSTSPLLILKFVLFFLNTFYILILSWCMCWKYVLPMTYLFLLTVASFVMQKSVILMQANVTIICFMSCFFWVSGIISIFFWSITHVSHVSVSVSLLSSS